MVIGPVQSGDTDLFVRGEQGRVRHRAGATEGGWSVRPRVLGAPWGAVECADTSGASLCLGVPTGPQQIPAETLLSLLVWDMVGPLRSPAHVPPAALVPVSHVGGSLKPPGPISQPLSTGAGEGPVKCAHACASTCTYTGTWGGYRAAGTRLLPVIRPQPAATVRLSRRV